MDRIRVAVLHAHLIPKTLKYAFIKQEAKGVFFSIPNHHRCLSQLFLLH